MICEKCGQEKVFHGFNRRLITKGKDKGKYWVTRFYSCGCPPHKKPKSVIIG